MLRLEQLAELVDKHRAATQAHVREFSIGDQFFPFNTRPAVMGVINLSPDSWYRESVCLSTDSALARGKVLHAQGADIIDVGAESTLAHAARVEEEAQASRLLPVIEGLHQAGLIVSAETYHPAVARLALEAGAQVLNLTGPARSEEIYRLAASHDAAVIICYVEGEHVRQVTDFSLDADPIPGCTSSSRARSSSQPGSGCKSSSSIRGSVSTTATCRTAPCACATN